MKTASHEERIKQTGFEALLPVLQGIGSVASAVGAVKSFTSKGPSAPAISKPTPMPTPDDDAIKAAKRRSIAGQLARSGRQSTILSDSDGSFLGA